MKNFSVMVLCYNSEEKALKSTLDSILCQKDTDFEIILADDASKNDCVEIAENYLKYNDFSDYKVMTHKENVGTVQNIYDALELAEGKYVKCIGAGDLLFEKYTLCKLAKFMDAEQCTMCFGKMQAYNYEDGKLHLMTLTVPQDITAFYQKNTDRIAKNIIQNHGWIAGASMFYNTKEFLSLLKELLGTVRYCEDLLQVNLLLHNKKISFFPYGAVYYEVGTGISTNNGNGNSNRVKNDHDHFWDMMFNKYRDNKMVRTGNTMNELIYIKSFPKKLISMIIKNPGYLMMCLKTKLQKKQYDIKEEGILS